MNMQPMSGRAERSMRALLFLALMLGVGWAIAGEGASLPMAALAGILGR